MTPAERTSAVVTLRRIRAHTSIIAITIWSIWLVNISRPGVIDRVGQVKGTDFLHFYAIGSLFREGRADVLYDVRANYERTSLIAESPRTWFLPVQSPQTAIAFAPLTALSYTRALATFVVVTFLFYGAACWLIWRMCAALHRYGVETAVACLAFPGLYETILHGQVSGVAVLCVAIALVALGRGRRVTAGVAFGCLAFKPHWVAAAAAIFVAAREWRVVIGIVGSAAAQIGLTYTLVGSSVMSAYWSALLSIRRVAPLLEPRPPNSLRGLFAAWVPSESVATALYVIAAIAALFVNARLWRTHSRLEIRLSGVVLTMILISPHAFEYDLILLAPASLLLANWFVDTWDAQRHPLILWALCAAFASPLLAVVPAVLRLQFSVTAMMAILLALWHGATALTSLAKVEAAGAHA